jgi:hypothetical protein
MEQNLVIYIGIWKALGIIGAIVTGVWITSKKLSRVETKVDMFETRMTNMEGRLDSAFASASPVKLLPKGETVLNSSGLKKYIDDKKNELLSQCKSKNEMKNQYDIQEATFKLFDQLDFGDFENILKETSYKYGMSIETIRRIGGIYFRDICLEENGFKPEDLDKPKAV